MIAAHCSCCCILVEVLVSPDIILRDRPDAICPGCGARGRLSCIEDDDDCNTISHIELVVPRSEVERLARQDRRDRRNHREMVQVMALHLIDPITIPLGDDSFGRGVALSRRLLSIRQAWQLSANARQYRLMGGGSAWEIARRRFRQRARDLSRHLRRVFAAAPELEREALEHVLAAARQP